MGDKTRRALLLLAGAGVLGATLWVQAGPKPARANYPSGFRAPVIALELPADRIELGLVLDAGPGNRAYWRGLTRADFWYPPVYASFFALLAWTAAARAGGGKRERWAWAASACFLFAALADYFENVAILTALDVPGPYLVDVDAARIRVPALIKWGLLSAGFLAIAPLHLAGPRARRLLAAPAALAGIGVLAAAKPVLVEWSMPGMLIVGAAEWIGAIRAAVRRG